MIGKKKFIEMDVITINKIKLRNDQVDRILATGCEVFINEASTSLTDPLYFVRLPPQSKYLPTKANWKSASIRHFDKEGWKNYPHKIIWKSYNDNQPSKLLFLTLENIGVLKNDKVFE